MRSSQLAMGERSTPGAPAPGHGIRCMTWAAASHGSSRTLAERSSGRSGASFTVALHDDIPANGEGSNREVTGIPSGIYRLFYAK